MVKLVLVLDVSFNNINDAEFHDSKMIELKIHNNNLSLLTIGDNLEKLDASFNDRDSFFIDFKNNKKLIHLNLAISQIKSDEKVIEAIMSFTQLQYLNLNHVSSRRFLQQDMLKDLRELETLKLRECLQKESKISENTFVGMKNLKELDLSHNFYDELNLDALRDSKNLEILNFQCCYASNLTGWRNLGTSFPRLKQIDFYRNRLSCNETEEIIEDFKKTGIEIVNLEEFGLENFLEDSSEKFHASDEDSSAEYYYNDDDADYGIVEKRHKKSKHDKHETSDYAWWIMATIFKICILIGGLVYVQKKLNIFSKIRPQDCDEDLVDRDF